MVLREFPVEFDRPRNYRGEQDSDIPAGYELSWDLAKILIQY
jgi:hypothetical protein